MGSETRPCIHDRAPHQCDECRFFGTRYPATPTSPSDGEADFAKADSWARMFVGDTEPDTDSVDASVGNLCRAYLALRAGPLPSDVEAAVEAMHESLVGRYPDDPDETPRYAMLRVGHVRTLLAHIQRTGPHAALAASRAEVERLREFATLVHNADPVLARICAGAASLPDDAARAAQGGE